MSKKSGSIISIPGLIVLGLVYNTFFGDDDDEKKKVEIPKDNKPAINLEVSDDLKETGKELLDVAKKAIKQAKKDFIDQQKTELEHVQKEEKEDEFTEATKEKDENDSIKIIEKAKEETETPDEPKTDESKWKSL